MKIIALAIFAVLTGCATHEEQQLAKLDNLHEVIKESQEVAAPLPCYAARGCDKPVMQPTACYAARGCTK